MYDKKIMISKALKISLLTLTVYQTFAQQNVLKTSVYSASTFTTSTTSSILLASDPTTKLIEHQKFSKVEELNGGTLENTFAPVGVDINVLPLFGGYKKTAEQIAEDKLFIADCSKNFKNKSESSDFFANMGWQYLSEGNKEMAIHRFNLAWLLDNTNEDSFWGLGVLEYQNGDFNEATRLMRKGLSLNEKNVTLIVDLATVYIKCYASDKSEEDLKNANELLDKALNIQPEQISAYMQKCLIHIINDDLDAAWDNFHFAFELDPENVSLEILNELVNRKDDPRGIFKKP
jgi:tetratricopeptide (TPR) repeat protein